MVLSFQAELRMPDAASMAEALYSDVFRPAASRNPESALVQKLANKYLQEFAYANWASMTVFLRRPLDLSALPLNGPRVPKAQWIMDMPSPADGDAPGTGSGTSAFTAAVAAIASQPSMGSGRYGSVGYGGGGYGAGPGAGAMSALERTGTFTAMTASSKAAPVADLARTHGRGSRRWSEHYSRGHGGQ